MWRRRRFPTCGSWDIFDAPVDTMRRMALLITFGFGLAFPVYLLAAIHVGLTRRGDRYLTLSAVAFGVQTVLSLLAQPALGGIAVAPVFAAGMLVIVGSCTPSAHERLVNPTSEQPLRWIELTIIPASVVLIALMVVSINAYYPGN
jgi:uncharacterized membrane protein